MIPRSLRLFLAILMLCSPVLRADVIDEYTSLQGRFDEALLDIHGGRWTPESWQTIEDARLQFGKAFASPEALAIWAQPAGEGDRSAVFAAGALGTEQARLQHAAATEMLWRQQHGDIEAAKEWRSIITLPKYANAIQGALALQRMGGDSTHRDEVNRLLAKEYVVWQITRAREKSDALARLSQAGRSTPALVKGRAAEIKTLSELPPPLLALATGTAHSVSSQDSTDYDSVLLASLEPDGPRLNEAIARWRVSLEANYPNLLSSEDVERRERIVLKLLRLIPMEYQAGVRDGEIVVPLEYREAKSFTIQCQQIINELMPVWRKTKQDAFEKHGVELLSQLDELEAAIKDKRPLSDVERHVNKTAAVLRDSFELTLKRAGTATDVVAETSLEIRSLLGQSLAAAQNKEWRKAEALRLDAYVNFDLEIESRTMPRDPSLALRAEKTFLDGAAGLPGIKAALDARLSGDALTASYQRSLDVLEECISVLKVGLSPTAAIISAVLIISREGLEAVVILAALLAGLRGPENAGIRHRIGMGAWLALAASAALFYASRTLLQGLSHYGENLEAVISIIAVAILLMVTNWVFHKYYWTGWNARLRDLSKAAQRQQATPYENLALIGVGFMTIFREGFETTLFMQSLIMEAGMKPVAIGLLIGGAIIAALGFAVFTIGAKLPYRKMLVVTGILVIFVLFTFMGSTVRLFQTVGWLPIHPIPGLDLPAWMGLWLGIYPSWEGVLIPFGSFAYVGSMWLWVKFSFRRAQMAAAASLPEGSLAK